MDNQRGREWAAHNIKSVDHFVEKNESLLLRVQRTAQWVSIVTGLALMRKKFKR